MVSDLRKKKYQYIFNTFFDTDKSGAIEKTEIDSLVDKLCQHKGWSATCGQAKEAREIWHKIYDGMLHEVDVDKDGKISVDEWVKLFDETSKTTEAEWFKLFGKMIFDYMDKGGDGEVTLDEFIEVQAIFGVNKDEATSSFKKLGVSTLKWADFQKLWKEFYVSDDPNAPGNFLCGKSSF